jgi:hypothetical protein
MISVIEQSDLREQFKQNKPMSALLPWAKYEADAHIEIIPLVFTVVDEGMAIAISPLGVLVVSGDHEKVAISAAAFFHFARALGVKGFSLKEGFKLHQIPKNGRKKSRRNPCR